jgi:outer membrane protein assembly factor BamB
MMGRTNTRNAVSTEKSAPLHWQFETKKGDRIVRPARNVKWEAQLGSGNFASPVVADGLVWVGTNNSNPRDPKVKGDASVLMCFRERDGRFLWQYVSPRLKSDTEDFYHSSINCSPLAEKGRLYFTTNRGEVVCLDVAPLARGTGKPRTMWKIDMRKDLGVHLYCPGMNLGLSCSIGGSYKGRLYVSTGNGVDVTTGRLPAPQAPSLICIDRANGRVLWSDRSPGKDIMNSQWSSPVLAEVAGRAQVLHGQGDGWLRSFDALSGKLLWKFNGNPKKAKPYQLGGRGERSFFVATPVLHDNKIFIGVGQNVEDGSGVGHLWCIDLVKATARGKLNKDHDVSPVSDNFDPNAAINKDSALVWHYGGLVVPKPKNDEDPEWNFGRTWSSVVVHDGLVIAPELAGYVHCLDARTGKRLWVHDTEENIRVSPLIADGKVYIPTNEDVTVLALSRNREVLAYNRANWPSAAPVIANGILFLATRSKLYAIHAQDDGKGESRAAGHWPQWRGADRRNVSTEKVPLLKEWPKEGPPLAWQVNGIGEGVGGVAVAGGRVYILGHREKQEHLTAIEEVTGKPVWSVPLGLSIKEFPFMRWLSQRTPLVDGARAYAVTARGELVCVSAATGKVFWRKDYPKDFKGQRGGFGVCDQLLVDGDQLICVPGGKLATVTALNKWTGEPIWKCPLGDQAAYVGAVLVSGDGVKKHYVAVTARGLVGVSTDGKLLWRNERFARNIANSYTPNVMGNRVFCASNYGRGGVLLELADKKDGVWVKEVYHRPLATPSVHEMVVCLGNEAYVGTVGGLVCLDLKTGEVLWQEKRTGQKQRPPYTGTGAGGRLYIRTQQGILLVDVSAKGHTVKGMFRLPGFRPRPGLTAPVVTGGRLYLRDEEKLYCYDVLAGSKPGKSVVFDAPPAAPFEERPGTAKKREPDAIYVPTPQDVVDKMLELAKVKKTDVVVDLGCGDGRIVVTAARRYGCRAIGFDIDPACVEMAKDNLKKQGVGALVAIEEKDFFLADLSKVDVVAVYLPPKVLGRLLPRFAGLPRGARIVSHAFAIPGVVPDRTLAVTPKEDGAERKVFLYTTPLKKEKKAE